MSSDFTEQMAYDLCFPWGPVDERLMEATFHGDPGFFLYCNHGLIYFLWHIQSIAIRGGGICNPNEDYVYVPKAMGFRLNCRTAEQRFTYHYMYYRWYKTVFPALDTDMSLFHDRHFLVTEETRRVKPGLQLAIMKARELLGRGGKKDAAVRLLCERDWDAVVNEPVPDFADCVFDADEIWTEYRLSRAADKNPRKIEWWCFLRSGYAYHCGQYTVYQSICQNGVISMDRLSKDGVKRNQAEMLRQHHHHHHHPLGSRFDRSEYAKMAADYALDYEPIAFPRSSPVQRTFPLPSADDSATLTPGTVDSSTSTSVSTSTSTPTSMTPSPLDDSISVNPARLRRRLTASEIAARNAESNRHQFSNSMGLRVYQSIEGGDQMDSVERAEADARLWKQYIND